MSGLKRKEVQSSLASGEASIIQTPTTSNAYNSLSSVARVASSSPPATRPTNEQPASSDSSRKEQPASSSMTDKLIDKLVAAALPTSSLNMADAERRATHMKSNPAFSIPIMGRNFSNMTARTGVAFDAYYSFLRIATWEYPTHTLSILGIYTIIVLNPRLIPTLPFIFILSYLMVPSYVYRHPPDPTLINPDPTIEGKVLGIISPTDYSLNYPSSSASSGTTSTSTGQNHLTSNAAATDVLIHHNPSPVTAQGPPLGEAIIPKPVPEISREFFMNMVDTQNAMVLYIDAYDSILATLKRFAFFDGDETTSSLVYIVLMITAVLAYIFTPYIIKYTPWKVVFLVLGWGAAIRNHPGYDHEKVIKPIKSGIKKTTARGKKTFKKVVRNIKSRRSDSSSSFSLDTIFSNHGSKQDSCTPAYEGETNQKPQEEISDESELFSDYGDDTEPEDDHEEEIKQEEVPVKNSDDTLFTESKLLTSEEPKNAFERALVYFKHLIVRFKSFISSSRLKFLSLNPMSNEFWIAIHTTAYAELNIKEPYEQRVVEVFEIQFARGRIFEKAAKATKTQGLPHERLRYSHWEPSLYSNQPYIPRTKLSTIYTTTSQQAQLQQNLAALVSSAPTSTAPVERNVDSDSDGDVEKAQAQAEIAAATASALASSSSDPFILPGLVQLNEILAPPFWQFVPGSSWKLDMHATEWVAYRGINLNDKDIDETSSQLIYSEDNTVAVDIDGKWVYDQTPISLEAERARKKSGKGSKNDDTETKNKAKGKESEQAPEKPIKDNDSSASTEESESYFSWLTDSSQPPSSSSQPQTDDVLWMRRRRWIRLCTRHAVIRDATK